MFYFRLLRYIGIFTFLCETVGDKLKTQVDIQDRTGASLLLLLVQLFLYGHSYNYDCGIEWVAL